GKLDITLRDVSLARQAHHGKGVIIERADPGGPADKAGLRSGDIVLAVADTEVQSIPQTIAAIRGHAPGSELSLRIVRNDQELKLTATVGELNIQERPPRIFKAGQDREIQW